MRLKSIPQRITVKSLDDLPVEILNLVAQYVGTASLLAKRADLLVISKAWYRAAAQVPYTEVELDLLSLDRFPPPHARTKDFIIRHLRTLSIGLDGLDRGNTPNRISPFGQYAYIDYLNKSESQLRSSLARLFALLPLCQALNNFHFRAFTHTDPADRSGFNRLYLRSRELTDLLSGLPLHSLSTVHFDSPAGFGSAFSCLDGGEDLCCIWETLLPRLKHLHLRMRSVCPSLFRQLLSSSSGLTARNPGDDESPPDTTIVCKKLQSFIVNTTMVEYDVIAGLRRQTWNAGENMEQEHAYKCKDWHASTDELCGQLAIAARDTLPAMPAIQTLRIVRHDLATGSLVAMDCLRMKTVGVPWEDWTDVKHAPDDDGQEVEVDKYELFEW